MKNRISKLDTQIRQGNIAIKRLGIQIEERELSIKELSSEIENSRKQLVAILRTINKEDQRPIVETFLAGESLSDFFNNLNSLEILNNENKKILKRIENLRLLHKGQKQLAEDEREETENIVKIQALQREEEDRTRKEREELREKTEAEYQKYLRERDRVARRAAQIRARLLELVDIPEAPTFDHGSD